GEQMEAAGACRLGVVARLLPDEDLAAAVDSLLEEQRRLGPSVLRLTRKTLHRLHFADFAKQLKEAERVYLSVLMKSHDAREGILAFLEKRKPNWKGK